MNFDSKRYKICSKCSKEKRTTNVEQNKHFDNIIEEIRKRSNIVPKDYLYDRGLLSGNPDDYRKLNVLTFFPNRMVTRLGLPNLKCWNGLNCKVPIGSRRVNKDKVKSEIVEKFIIIRCFDGILCCRKFVVIPHKNKNN